MAWKDENDDSWFSIFAIVAIVGLACLKAYDIITWFATHFRIGWE